MRRLPNLSLAALALLLTHVVSIAVLGSGDTGSFVSDSLQLVIAVLAGAACCRAARKSRNPARSFWSLTAGMCALWSATQALLLYYGYFYRAPHSTAPQFLGFFFSMAPLFFAVFLVSENQSHKLETDEVLDAVQILIVIGAAYLFFVYVPGAIKGERQYAATRLLVLHVRNIALTLGLTVRALGTRSRNIRRLFLPMAVIMGVYTLGTWMANHSQELWNVPGNWFDVAWSLPFAMITIAAAAWRDAPEESAAAPRARRTWGPMIVYFAPVVLPLLVLFSSDEGLRKSLAIATAAVAASFLCYGLRIAAVEHRERRTQEALAKSEEQLRQSQKMEAVGRLAGGVAHDFNNLLTVISGYSQLLMESTSAGDPRHHSAEEIKGAADRAAALTRQLLAFSRQQILQPRVINLNPVIQSLEKMMRRLIGEDIEIVIRAAPDLGSIKTDPNQMEQVIMNLAINARDAMPNGGKLTLETANVDLYEGNRELMAARPGPYVMLAVTDTGTGMDEETRTHIFEPFFTTKELGKGTGLGLSTVYGIVHQSEGFICVYSEPGQGTTFKVYLPRVEQPADSAPAQKSRATGLRGTETILLVEDDSALRALAETILSACGYRVLVARRPADVDELCRKHANDLALLLTDVIMPDANGPELARRVKRLLPRVKVVLMSGYTDRSLPGNSLLQDGFAFLQKPFTPGTLAEKVRQVLDQPATLPS